MPSELFPAAADTLLIAKADLDRIIGHLRQALPNEGVGLIGVERIERDGMVLAQSRRFYPGSNARASPVRYEMDAHDLISALRDIDRENWALGAIVHSHPHGPANPSATDIAEFLYPEALLVIASFAGSTVDVQAWKLERAGATWNPRNVPISHPSDCMSRCAIAKTGTLRE